MNDDLTPTVEDIETSDTSTSDVPPPDELTADNSSSEVDSTENPVHDVDENLKESTNTSEVTQAVGDNELTVVDFLELDFVKDLQEFYNHYLVKTPDGIIQVFQSLTYGELLISFLLLMLIVLYIMKWFYEILRY